VDLARVSEKLRDCGAKLVLDLTQSLGTASFDLSAIRPDFAIAAGYKWLLGPYTLGYAYIAPEYQSGLPLEEGWIVREGAEDFARLVDYADAYQHGARRFDMGERSGFQLVPAALDSLKWLNGLGTGLTSRGLAGAARWRLKTPSGPLARIAIRRNAARTICAWPCRIMHRKTSRRV
jgi:selenocysteine lyase/cysteine desulfurase